MMLTPLRGTRLDMVDAAGESKEPFQVIGDVAFHLFRRHSSEEGSHHHHRNVIAGNISTGIWTTLTTPRMAAIAQTTMIK